MITLLPQVHSLRWTLPCIVMMGSAPYAMMIWSMLRLLTAPLPCKFYTMGESVMFASYMKLLLFFFNTYTKVKVHVYGDADVILNKDENVIYLSNHQSTVDWVVACMLSEQRENTGRVRYIMKNGLKYLPVHGFCCYQHCCIFVGRSGRFKEENFKHQLQHLKKNDIPVWLVIFPEGTRYNPELPELIEKSKKYAATVGFLELEHVLTPRTMALQTSLQQLDSHVTAVYDVTIAYSNTFNTKTGERVPAYSMPDFIMGKSPDVHLNIERIDIKDIPLGEKQLQHWLFQQFQKKDRLLSGFYNPDSELFGRFPGDATVMTVKPRQTVPTFLFYTASLVAILSFSKCRSLYMKGSVVVILGGIVWVSFRS